MRFGEWFGLFTMYRASLRRRRETDEEITFRQESEEVPEIDEVSLGPYLDNPVLKPYSLSDELMTFLQTGTLPGENEGKEKHRDDKDVGASESNPHKPLK